MHSYVKAMVRAYRECPELGWGQSAVLDCAEPAVLAHQVTWEDRCLVAVHNLGEAPVTARLALPTGRPAVLQEPLGHTRVETDRLGAFEVPLGRYGHVWLHVGD